MAQENYDGVCEYCGAKGLVIRDEGRSDPKWLCKKDYRLEDMKMQRAHYDYLMSREKKPQ